MIRSTMSIVGLMFCCSTVAAESEVDFKNKAILMVVGFAPGGGTDAAGRLIAGSLGRQLPGGAALKTCGHVEGESCGCDD